MKTETGRTGNRLRKMVLSEKEVKEMKTFAVEVHQKSFEEEQMRTWAFAAVL